MPDIDHASERPACGECDAKIARLTRRLERERAARSEAERTAEKGLRDLYATKCDLDLLCMVAAEANTAATVTDILKPAMAAILEGTGWPFACAYIVEDASGGQLSPCASIATRDDLASLQVLFDSASFCIDWESPLGKSLSAGEVVFTQELHCDPMPVSQRLVAVDAGMRLLVTVPVRSRDRIVAVIRFMTPSISVDRVRKSNLLRQVADQVAHVSERQRLAEQLVHDALHDPLTKLPNRQLFTDRLKRAAAEKQAGGLDYSVLFLDLDRFKAVNDTFGHAAGDRLLVEVASRISRVVEAAALAPPPTIARVGGDEFCILVENEPGPEGNIGHALARDLVSCIASPFDLGADRAEIGVSIGVAPSFRAIGDGDLVLKRADTAMYGAKSKGRGQVQLYDRRFWELDVRRERLIKSLREAASNDFRGFTVVFQPIVDIANGRLKGYEALLRFVDETGAAVGPGEFIPLAEENGSIQAIGGFVLDRALHAQSLLAAAAPHNARTSMSINVSPLQLTRDFPVLLQSAIAAHRVDPALIDVEITEGVVIDTSDRTIEVLDAIRALGVNLSIDDFGSGYATFGSLRHFAFKTLKIDRSFIDALGDGDGDQIVRAMIEMGRGLGVAVIAEGIETAEQARMLDEMGCPAAQGYFYAQPMALDDVLSGLGPIVDIPTVRAA